MSELMLIVKVTTNNYMHNNKIVACKTATLMKRKSNGELSDLILEPEIDIIDIDLAIKEDGLYRLTTSGHSFGFDDDCDLSLSPFSETKPHSRG